MIRKASLNDLQAIFEVENDNFTPEDFGLSRESIRYHLKRNIVYVIEEQGKVAGYCLWLSRKHFYRLYSIAVLKTYQGKGYGKALLEHSIQNLYGKPLQLEVKCTNIQAISLYEKLGFKQVKLLPHYYPKGIDGCLMRLS